MRSESAVKEEIPTPDRITETIADKLSNPATSSDFDFYKGVNQVLAEVGMSAADSGGQLSFYGQDPIVPSRIRFATMAGMGLPPKLLLPRRFGETEPGRDRIFILMFARHIDVSPAFSRVSGRP